VSLSSPKAARSPPSTDDIDTKKTLITRLKAEAVQHQQEIDILQHKNDVRQQNIKQLEEEVSKGVSSPGSKDWFGLG